MCWVRWPEQSGLSASRFLVVSVFGEIKVVLPIIYVAGFAVNTYRLT